MIISPSRLTYHEILYAMYQIFKDIDENENFFTMRELAHKILNFYNFKITQENISNIIKKISLNKRRLGIKETVYRIDIKDLGKLKDFNFDEVVSNNYIRRKNKKKNIKIYSIDKERLEKYYKKYANGCSNFLCDVCNGKKSISLFLTYLKFFDYFTYLISKKLNVPQEKVKEKLLEFIKHNQNKIDKKYVKNNLKAMCLKFGLNIDDDEHIKMFYDKFLS